MMSYQNKIYADKEHVQLRFGVIFHSIVPKIDIQFALCGPTTIQNFMEIQQRNLELLSSERFRVGILA